MGGEVEGRHCKFIKYMDFTGTANSKFSATVLYMSDSCVCSFNQRNQNTSLSRQCFLQC